jgi:hypothetical protein
MSEMNWNICLLLLFVVSLSLTVDVFFIWLLFSYDSIASSSIDTVREARLASRSLLVFLACSAVLAILSYILLLIIENR